MKPDFWRQFDIVRPDQDLAFPITVVGCGGIGSPTVLALAKMGCADITVWDDDTVENHNVPNQVYKLSDIGKPKVESLAGTIREFADVDLKTHAARVDGRTSLEGVVISGVDSMAARSEIWKAVRFKTRVGLYIDARMGAEVCRIYTVNPTNPDQIKRYEATLYSDDAAQQLPCTGRAIIYNVFMIAALISNQVKKFGRGQAFPFEIIFDLVTMTCMTSS